VVSVPHRPPAHEAWRLEVTEHVCYIKSKVGAWLEHKSNKEGNKHCVAQSFGTKWRPNHLGARQAQFY